MLTQRRRQNQEPAPDQRVRALLAVAAAPDEPGPVPGEAAALAAFREAHPVRPGSRAARRPRRTAARTLAAAAVGAGVLLTGGMAAAATGSLPAQAQQQAHTILARVGVSVPSGPAQHAGQHGTSKAPHNGPASGGSATPNNQPGSAGSHGAAVSAGASNGHSHAGEHGQHGNGWAKHKADHPGKHLAKGHAGPGRDDNPSGHTGQALGHNKHDRTPRPGGDPTPGDSPPVAVDSPDPLSSPAPSDR
jgi:hypothetical protein